MRKLSLRQQLIMVAIFAGSAFVVSFLLALLGSGARHDSGVSPWFVGMTFGVVTSMIYLGLSANRPAPLADAAARAQAMAPVPPQMGRLLVVREGFVGKLAGVDVQVDGSVRAQLRSPRFAAFDLPPGQHRVQATLPNRESEPLVVELPAGEVAAVRIVIGMGKPRLEREADIAGLQQRLPGIPMVAA
ncbi:DUF2846 domain-containing protein [Sphingomonas sp. PL-96]|uniref:DUF2846 domain-containing protein n=1 Tax=Sphingomonas sp. PL-96 TaxID=2887201 RepID=UPI001E4A0720|nr:DUF2846 domain-containing protein [Sphingomonas sp. PL-96]MCC2977430.1 DUF2846 domain-containing protein [Sphingomonas sp. PL-96]